MHPFIDITSDNHVHTRLCHHAIGEMEEYVISAIDVGLSKLSFLEHMEAGVSYFETTWLTEEDFDYYFEEGKRLQEKFADLITIQLGVEVGYNPKCCDELIQRLARRKWDCIGISYHFGSHQPYQEALNLVSRKEPSIERIDKVGRDIVLKDYFKQLIEAVKHLPGTHLCHLDAALRHQQNLVLKPQHLEQIEELLLEVKKKGMSLEINTSGYALRSIPYPEPRFVKRAVELEIPLIASSDAHKPEDVGRYFDQLPDYITNCLG